MRYMARIATKYNEESPVFNIEIDNDQFGHTTKDIEDMVNELNGTMCKYGYGEEVFIVSSLDSLEDDGTLVFSSKGKKTKSKKPTMSQMRQYIMLAYPSMSWQKKAMEMKPKQVAAIYDSLIRRKKDAMSNPYTPVPSGIKNVDPLTLPEDIPGHQLSIFEYMTGNKDNAGA